jgi:release factor glutamine methyltransferase
MTVGELRRQVRLRLAGAGVGRPELEVDWILAAVLGVSREALRAHPERAAEEAAVARARECADRRAKGEPLAYVLGEAEFFGFPFFVGPGCLVPRPETELLIEEACRLFPGGAAFADWGTGSGCLLIALLRERGDLVGFGVDAEAAALDWARRNVARHGLEGRATLLLRANPAEAPIDGESLGGIVTNPPYIPGPLLPGLMREVREHEPPAALDGGPTGLEIPRLFLATLPRFLRSGGWLLMETGGEEQVEALARETPPGLLFEGSIRDYGGILRHARWRKR